MELCAGKWCILEEVCSVAECPSHPSESLTLDTREANSALFPLHLPTLTRSADTCHTTVTWEDCEEENTQQHNQGDKLGQLYMGIIVLQDGHHKPEPLEKLRESMLTGCKGCKSMTSLLRGKDLKTLSQCEQTDLKGFVFQKNAGLTVIKKRNPAVKRLSMKGHLFYPSSLLSKSWWDTHKHANLTPGFRKHV